MRVPRIFQNVDLNTGMVFELDERACKHLVQVLRSEAGRPLIVFNGNGGEYHASLLEVSKRKALIQIDGFSDINRETETHIHLAQCISKGDRFEFALQKAVELGVKEITPVLSQRSQLKFNHERKDKKFRHWQQVIVSACEQSGRTALTQLNEPKAFSDFLEAQSHNERCKLILEPEADSPFSSIKAAKAFTVLIGPEGGFEEQEVELAERNDFQAVRLGKQILRTETAPISAISALHFLNKEF